MLTFSVEVRYRTNSGCNTKLFPCIAADGMSEAIEIATNKMRHRRGVIKIDGGDAIVVFGDGETVSQKLDDSRKRERCGGWSIGSVYVGRQLNEHLYAEQVGDCRFVIRSTKGDASFAKRVGEVFGRNGDYQACTMRGTHVALATSVLEAAKALDGLESTKLSATREQAQIYSRV